MTEREIFKKYESLSENELNSKNKKETNKFMSEMIL